MNGTHWASAIIPVAPSGWEKIKGICWRLWGVESPCSVCACGCVWGIRNEGWGGGAWSSVRSVLRVPGGFHPPLFGLSFNSTGSLRFALAKCYKCFDNLVSDPRGSPRRARGYNGFTPRDLTKQHEDEYIHTCIHSPGLQMLILGWLVWDAHYAKQASWRIVSIVCPWPNLWGQKNVTFIGVMLSIVEKKVKLIFFFFKTIKSFSFNC